MDPDTVIIGLSIILVIVSVSSLWFSMRRILWYRKDIRRMDREAEERRNG